MGYTVVDGSYSPSDFSDEVRKQIIEDQGQNLKRGDIVALNSQEHTYRNDGKAIFDGEDIVPLGDDLDDYGYVPPTFFVGDEFPILHWKDEIVHNSIVWINPRKHREQLLATYDGGEDHWISIVDFPLGTYQVWIAKVDEEAEDGEDLLQKFKDEVMSGEPIPVSGVNDRDLYYPWYLTPEEEDE